MSLVFIETVVKPLKDLLIDKDIKKEKFEFKTMEIGHPIKAVNEARVLGSSMLNYILIIDNHQLQKHYYLFYKNPNI
ncbi:hypothetical protein RclHR1_05330010 [Rhizophagus clarus]|uniref:Uncharacterized protein n=1 Tax=Rhizophagus clarus TaxID=94130 RepID=A0A2Z6RNG1_9GLOM|nr:hypothetical protein RclHR1_05330010 [Rhizophagus clarus]GES77810.1 hypothetical protein RCL_e20820_RclHR1_05330010 [Rhizophagus clarus]